MTFDEYEVKLLELYEKRFDEAYTQNDDYKTVIVEFNEVFLNLVKSSITEQKFFSGSPLDIFILELNRRLEINEKDEIDFDENEFLKTLYLFLNKIFRSNRHNVHENSYYFIPTLNDKNYNLFRSILRKRIEYLEKLLFKKGIEVTVTKSNPETNNVSIAFKKHINIMVENDNIRPLKNHLEILSEIDLSDSKAVEKIIYLNELGIIDFLRTKTKVGISNSGLASVLSGITGIKAETIKPSLNRLSSNDTMDNKHPYYTTKTVEKVKMFLTKLGF